MSRVWSLSGLAACSVSAWFIFTYTHHNHLILWYRGLLTILFLQGLDVTNKQSLLKRAMRSVCVYLRHNAVLAFCEARHPDSEPMITFQRSEK